MLREMVALPHNKQCFDCHQRGPTYVDMTIGSFVCTSCSGILRGLNPPHRVKSISMASFSPDEMDFLKAHGNELCRKVFLGLYDSRAWPEPDSRDEQRVRDFMVQKYENKRWYVAPTEAMKDEARRMNEVSSQNKPSTKPLRSLLGENAAKLVVQNNQSPQMIRNHPTPSAPVIATPQAVPHPPAGGVQVVAPQPQAPQKQSSGFDLLGDLGGDPFASTPPGNTGNSSGGGFADFSNFGSQPTAAAPAPVPASVPPPSAFPISAAPLQPMGSTTGTAIPAGSGFGSTPASQSQTFPIPSAGDRYAALADLDSVFGISPKSNTNGNAGVGWGGVSATTTAAPAPVPAPVPATVNWGGSSGTMAGTSGAINWGGSTGAGGSAGIAWNGTSTTSSTNMSGGWNSQPANSTGLFSSTTTAANPFGGSTSTSQPQATMGAQPNPFGAGGQGMFVQPQPAGGAGASFSQFGGAPTQSAAGSGGFGQFGGMQNGGFGTTTGGFGFTQTAPAFGGSTGVPQAFGQQPQGFPAQQAPVQGFPAQQPQGFGGAWGQVQGPAAGNPFMNAAAQQQVPPRSNSTNPFL